MIDLKRFLCDQHCIPWKLRLLIRKIIPWRIRRLLTRGRINVNAPMDMDARYAAQGDDFASMENLYEHILTFLPSSGRLLDAGCGIAVLLRAIRHRHPGLELHGVDFSKVGVERTIAYGFHAKQTVLPALDYPAQFFDCVVCTEVLEHLDHPLETIRAFHHVMKPGALLIVSVPNGMGPDHCQEHVQDFTEGSLRACLQEGGFLDVKVNLVEREPHRKPGASFVAVSRRECQCS